jgi:hypothetical protein
MVAAPILAGIAIGLFGGGFATAVGVIIATTAPKWNRICRLALGNVEPAYKPLSAIPFAKAARL